MMPWLVWSLTMSGVSSVECRGELLLCRRLLRRKYLRAFDDDRLHRHVAMPRRARAGLHLLDALDDIQAFHHLAEHGVAVALWCREAEIERVVVRDVDEELRGRGMGVGRARHGDRAHCVLQPVAGLVLHRLEGRLLLEVMRETADMVHEA